ncbi:dienelactone hydrolase family protein [Phenylobacterium hankyongense]|uniref:Dienelactone hydrolase family protein n=1 Tax=Phenylobacterium hankyongense TaxID=1813876 RepID=A0A328AZ42_9CAUL|nr:dienelactone hydrolase family protein [Phenylobacterium hankyongense]RAK60412.1 dienelactone hydrolase family protein [Phenylobacterium hankyongense]
MSRQDVSIPTPDGDARAFAFTPDEGRGPWPAVIMFMDAPAIRPALFEMAQRLASHGYYVLLPDMFWRVGPYEPVNLKEAFKDDESRRAFFGKFMSSTNPEKSMRDVRAFLDWLSDQPKARADNVGVTGYCMGGGIAFRAAGTYPDRIAAAAAFHPGNLATDAEDSPHLLAPYIKARVLVAGGDEDRSFDDAQKDRLAQALRVAGVKSEVTIYRGARHGYAPPDMPVYDREASERHWREMVALFDATLRQNQPA